jgi:glycosyltransferase involved in cell wall biosynthesis
MPGRNSPTLMSRLNIVHTESSCGWGGQELRILSEAQGLLERGHRVRIACAGNSQIFDEARRQHIPVDALPMTRRGPHSVARLRRWLNDTRPDVINTHSSTDSWLVALAQLAGPRTPVVRTRHISAPLTKNPLTRWLYRSATNCVVTTGELIRAQLTRELGLPPERVVSIPTGIDLERFSRAHAKPREATRALLGLDRAARVAGIVATLRSWKGHDDLLEAVRFLTGEMPDFVLLIVGDGPRREHIENLIRRRGLDACVKMLGARTDVPDLLNAMDVFVLTSYANEGVPQAIMQAMALGLPVVATRVGAIDEVVEDGVTGSLVPARDQPALTEALATMLRDARAREHMGAVGRARAEQKCRLAQMLDRMEEVFYQVTKAN